MNDDVISLALAYAGYRWMGTPTNVMHGADPDGVPIDTPDLTWRGDAFQCGWWQIGQLNTGVPYSWGNASTLDEFGDGIRAGMYAGNVPEDKRRRISRFTVGVDCSGLLTRCWQLPQRITTRDIPAFADVLSCIDEIQPGDVLAKPGSHAMIFVRFEDSERRKAIIIDATRSTGKVSQRLVEVAPLLANGYKAYRRKVDGAPDKHTSQVAPGSVS